MIICPSELPVSGKYGTHSVWNQNTIKYPVLLVRNISLLVKTWCILCLLKEVVGTSIKNQAGLKKSPRYNQFTLNSQAISGIELLASHKKIF